jgi:c-di-GMP-binding flagellar brake protein YcgR
MAEGATGAGPPAQGLERRIMPRCALDEEAVLLLVGRGARVPCRIVELSLTGCRMRTRERLSAGGELRVEATFKVHGIAFRFGGAIEWAEDTGLVGIRFVELIPRRRDELIEVLCELEAEIAAKAETEASERRAADERASQEAEKPATEPADAVPFLERLWTTPLEIQAKQPSGPVPAFQAAKVASQPVLRPILPLAPLAGSSQAFRIQSKSQAATEQPARPAKRERRVQSRHEVDTTADIFLINVGSRLSGRILDLSVGGCRIRTDERFPVGIYTRVETEFRLEGLPFRLGGVIQAVHDRDRRLVGIRFLDMSIRKREQLEQLIEEIEELQSGGILAKPGDSGELRIEGSGPELTAQAPVVSQATTAADQVEDQNDDRNDEQNMDQAASDMEAEA